MLLSFFVCLSLTQGVRELIDSFSLDPFSVDCRFVYRILICFGSFPSQLILFFLSFFVPIKPFLNFLPFPFSADCCFYLSLTFCRHTLNISTLRRFKTSHIHFAYCREFLLRSSYFDTKISIFTSLFGVLLRVPSSILRFHYTFYLAYCREFLLRTTDIHNSIWLIVARICIDLFDGKTSCLHFSVYFVFHSMILYSNSSSVDCRFNYRYSFN